MRADGPMVDPLQCVRRAGVGATSIRAGPSGPSGSEPAPSATVASVPDATSRPSDAASDGVGADGREPRSDGEHEAGVRRRSGVWGAAALMAAMAGLWAYAFLAPQDVPGRMDDTAFPTAAEPVCAAAAGELAALPRSLDATDPVERAAQVDASTDRLEAMVDELATLVPTTEPEQQMVTEWLDDWRRYLANRRDYADRLAAGDIDARFYVDQSERDGRQITNALDRFADINKMSSCASPSDVG